MLTYADVCLGHRIDAYRIHAGKSVPIVKGPDYGDKMEENEWYSLALLVQKYLLTGTKVQILTPEEDQLRVTKKADVLWEINFNDLVFDDPPEVHADVC